MNNGPAHGRQRGVALVVALIMLLAVTLIAVSASNLVQSNLKIVQNMESRDMVRAAAHSALEEAISSGRFMASPEAMFVVSCEEDNQRCYDFNGDGTNDVTVAVAAPTCVVVQPIKNSELDVFNSAADASCYLPPAVYSMCANSVWEFEATATDAVTGAEIVVRQGVGVLTTLNQVDTVCPL
jgi:Tfp pilus assembly protein PilX